MGVVAAWDALGAVIVGARRVRIPTRPVGVIVIAASRTGEHLSWVFIRRFDTFNVGLLLDMGSLVDPVTRRSSHCRATLLVRCLGEVV